MLVLGDAHADEPEKREKLLRVYQRVDEDVAVQVGDLGYYDLPKPTWFIAGNNEDLDVIDGLRDFRDVGRNVRLIASEVVEIERVRVAGLSGNYAPTKYDNDREDLEGSRRRHFVRNDVERAKELADVDVFLAHEAPHGVIDRGYDVGCRPVDEILMEVEPSLCLVGHHHTHTESMFGSTRVVSLAPVWKSYYTLGDEGLRRFSTP